MFPVDIPQTTLYNIIMVTTIENTPSKALSTRKTIKSDVLALSQKATTFRTINASIPNNDFGLPTIYYRADLLPGNLLDLEDTEQAQTLDMATIELDYSQGFPTTPMGEPFWGQLPHESSEAYRAFNAYLDLPMRGEDKGGSAAVRQLHLLKTELATTTQNLVELSYMYYWQQRARAFDVFKIASHNRMREQRLMSADNEHYRIASEYITLAESFLKDVFADPESNGLKPRDAMDLLIKMIQVQRLSVGVAPFSNPNGQNGGNGIPQNASLEVILRTIAKQMGTDNTGNEGVAADLADITKKLLSDPNELAKAQELIIRVNNTGDRTRNLSPASIDENPYDNRS